MDKKTEDKIAERLESQGLWRRAASRWLDVMLVCETDEQRYQVSQRRRYCLSMLSSPEPDNKLGAGAIRRAAAATQEAMGINGDKKGIEFRRVSRKGRK